MQSLFTRVCWSLKECDGKPKVNYVTVFERPGLQDFLRQVSQFAELVLFTAGLEGLLITFHFLFYFSLNLALPFPLTIWNVYVSELYQVMLDHLLTE